MQTRILSKNELFEAVICLKKGLPVIFPTETVYGLGACIFDRKGIQKIFSLKNRPSDNPLIAHIASVKDTQKIALDLDARFELLAKQFLARTTCTCGQKKSSHSRYCNGRAKQYCDSNAGKQNCP